MGTPPLLLLLLTPTALGLMVARCPEGWTARGGTNQCYRVHSFGRDRTFNDARVYCQARGGDLAYIDKEDLRDWLGQLIGATGNVGQYAYMWVGAKKLDGSWKWVETNEPVDNVVVQWDGSGDGDCAALTSDSKLIKQDCSQQLKFICHRNIEIPMACDYTTNWEDAGDRCYKKSSSSNSWHDAEVECVIEGGHLVTIEDEAEQQLAHDLAVEERDKVWIGYTEENHPGSFTWVDGSDSNFTVWHNGHPDTSLNGFGAVVVDNDDPKGSWMVEKITNEFHYLCEKPKGSCLPGWEEFESSCYYFNMEAEDYKVWSDAKDTCEKVKAKMVVLDTEVEDVFFRTHMPESATPWIGLYSESGDNIYWTDGQPMSSKNFTHMSDEDKDAALANPDQLCVYLQETLDTDGVTKTSAWVPSDCTTPHPYVCEAEAGAELSLLPPDSNRFCPDGDWEQFGDFCYHFSPEEKSWPAAQTYCQNLHSLSDLVSIITWAEQGFVATRELGNGWIGLNQRTQPDTWTWSDGSALLISNWEPGEPNGAEESCVEMYFWNGKWNDMFCSDLKPFTCKMPASTSPIGTITTTTAIPDSSACGFDWTENPTTGECYRIEVRDMIFKDARLHCQELYHYDGQPRPDLVSIASAEEQVFVFSLLAAQHLSQAAVWIGMTNDIDLNLWVDGTPTTYYHFNDGEPNSFFSEECIEMYTSTGMWNDAYCQERRPFICEKKGRNYVGLPPLPPPEVSCPEGWYGWGYNCYYFSDDKTDWFTAESNCQGLLNSHLVSVTNLDENEFVKGVLAGRRQDSWLGLRDDDNGANWHWVDGSLYYWTHWSYGEPNNANEEEHCGEMRAYDSYWDGAWNDIKCSTNNHYVCKFPASTCPQNWAYRDGKCYYVSDTEASRNEGEIKCQEMNGEATLVNIHSQEENQFFKEQLSQSSQSCWMGLQYDGANWTWADGTSMDYVNWNTNEPNNMETETCGEMIDNPNDASNGKWNNLPCGERRAFGCEMYPAHILGCEDEWQPFGDYCYWLGKTAMDDYATHDQVRQLCLDKGGDLASIHSEMENEFLYSMRDGVYSNTLIGFTDIDHHLLFKWDDGTPVLFTYVSSFIYTNLKYSQICGCYNYYNGPVWFLDDCNSFESFICKKPMQAISLHPEPTGCDEGDLYFEASCYHLPTVSYSWEKAKSACEGTGHLLVLENQYEAAFMSAMLEELNLEVWLGLSGTIASDGAVTFSWVNGAPLDYTYWEKYEPDPEHGTCVMASGKRSGFWGTRSCDGYFQYFCEYERVGYTTPPPPTTRDPSELCLYDWELKGRQCYKVMQDGAIWGDAEARCAQFGGHLASVRDELEQSIILALPGMEEVAAKSSNVWLGLKMGENSGYEWTDGTGLDFVNWGEGQPNSHAGRETCVAADSSTLKLANSVCLAHLPFICEAPTGGMMTTAIVPTKPPLELCQGDSTWYKFKNHCYKFISSTEEPGQTWWRAHRLCRDEGGELASISSSEENYWIESMIYDRAGLAMWLGGRAKIGTGYEWLDDYPFIYDNWAPGEPNDVHDQEDCISMYTNNQGYWNDMNCGVPSGRVCKRQDGVTLPPATTAKVPDGNCPLGWIHTGTKCVYFIMDRLNFTTARQVCQKLGRDMDLASVHSAAEQAYLTAAMVTLDQHMWIGMRYELNFYWVDQSGVTYTNWGAGEPNGGAGKEECVEVSSDTGLWNDISCSDEFGAVCMMTQDPGLPDNPTTNSCPSPHTNYAAYDGACYRAVDTPQTWKEAEATCQEEGAHLASIMTVADNSFMWASGQQTGLKSFWTGLTNKENLETFEWSDGWPTIYTNWGDREPGLNPIIHSCVIMNVTDGRWYTKGCDKTFTFICKYSNETAPTPDPPTTGYCPDNRWQDLKGSYCYLFSNETETWSNANMYCVQEDAHLVSVHSKQEMKLLTLHMQDYNEPYWIGLVETSNGESWTDHTSLNYLNWMIGEPNSAAEQCTEALAKSGVWNDVLCDTKRYYICKTKKIQEATAEPPPTPPPTKPDDHGNPGNKLSGGGIAGIVIAVLFVVAAMGFVGYTYVQKQPKGSRDQQHLSFENIAYREDNTGKPGSAGDGGVTVINVVDGSDA